VLDNRQRHAFRDYSDGVIDHAPLLHPLLRLAIEPITNLADGPVLAGRCLLNELLRNQPQLALFGDWIDLERSNADGVGEQLFAGSTGRITALSGLEFHDPASRQNSLDCFVFGSALATRVN